MAIVRQCGAGSAGMSGAEQQAELRWWCAGVLAVQAGKALCRGFVSEGGKKGGRGAVCTREDLVDAGERLSPGECRRYLHLVADS
jgi:hypothetical protein